MQMELGNCIGDIFFRSDADDLHQNDADAMQFRSASSLHRFLGECESKLHPVAIVCKQQMLTQGPYLTRIRDTQEVRSSPHVEGPTPRRPPMALLLQ